MNKKTNFGIIVTVTVMMGAMVLSSCSHEDYFYSEEKAEQTINDKYAAAFEKAFGKVGPNVDWGFSSKNVNARAFTRAKSDYAGYRGNIQPTISFPSDCDPSNFLKEVPEGVGKLPNWGGNAGLASSFYIDEAYQMFQTYNGAAKLYVKGSIDLSEGDTNPEAPRLNLSTTSELYLLKGATLKIGEVSAKNLACAAIYIAEGATLQTDYKFWANSGIKIYNHGTIISKSFEPNFSSFLYNVGTLTTESVTAESNDSRIVNDGTFNCTSVTVNAGAVQNNAEWNVTGTTKINSNNSGWVNNGHWTTLNYTYIGGSENVINNCFLEVTNDFEMNISSVQGAFKIDGGGGVLTKNFIGGGYSKEGAVSGPFVVEMGVNAVFVVSETAKLESGRGDDEGFGFFGPSTGGYAVLQAKNIVRDPYLESINSHGAVTYGGNLYVSAETHFAQGHDSDGSGTYVPQPFIYERGSFKIANNIYAAGFKSGKPSINIPQSPCNPGFQGGDPLYRVIAEDLSASESGDFDFNDVVFDVVKAENGKTTLKLICAGGVLPLRVMGIEVHGLFGETTPNEKGEYKMYNTGAGPTEGEKTFEIDGEYKTPEEIIKITIEVEKDKQWLPLTATKGKAACKILVDDSFVPVAERRNISDQYGLFTNYVRGQFQNDFWWK